LKSLSQIELLRQLHMVLRQKNESTDREQHWYICKKCFVPKRLEYYYLEYNHKEQERTIVVDSVF
jgi:hypothetical protein